MLDLVFLAMFLVVPAMFWSIRLAKQGKFDGKEDTCMQTYI